MSIWLILFILLAIATIITAILAENEKGIVFAILTYVQLLLCTVCLVVAIVFPLSAKKNIVAFKITAKTVETLGPVVGYEDFEEEIAKANEWLIEANDNLRKYGAFSKYFNTELSELEEITVPTE